MIPEGYDIELEVEEKEEDIFQTYKIDWDTKRIKGLITDPVEALEQYVIKSLRTSRYAFAIYNDQYGLDDIFKEGATNELIESELTRAIKDALIYDYRILSVEDFVFRYEQKEVKVEFTIKSIYGTVRIKTDFKAGG